MSVVRAWEYVALAVHALRGSRGLTISALGFLVLAMLEPFLPPFPGDAWIAAPFFLVFVIGVFTLPREAVAAQQRARHLLTDPHAVQKMARRLVWPLLLAFLLLPRIVLAVYGIPHMSPLAGLAAASIQRRVTLLGLFGILLVTILYLRSSRRYAPHIHPQRPKDLSRDDRSHRRRDVLMVMLIALLIAWAWLLHPFWRPFTLLDWPPSLHSLSLGVRGVQSITFALVIPVLLFFTVVAHLALLQDVARLKAWRPHAPIVAMAGAHIALALVCVALHAYAVLWILRYQTANLF